MWFWIHFWSVNPNPNSRVKEKEKPKKQYFWCFVCFYSMVSDLLWGNRESKVRVKAGFVMIQDFKEVPATVRKTNVLTTSIKYSTQITYYLLQNISGVSKDNFTGFKAHAVYRANHICHQWGVGYRFVTIYPVT